MPDKLAYLQVYEAGERTVVGLQSGDFPSEEFLPEFESELNRLTQQNRCKVLAFDLTGVNLIRSSIISFLVWLRNRGLSIQLLNPSDYVCEDLQTAHLDRLLEIRRAAKPS
jgi:hypothetical protein